MEILAESFRIFQILLVVDAIEDLIYIGI